MNLSAKAWLVEFPGGNLNGLVQCSRKGGFTGYRLPWNSVMDRTKTDDLEKAGIYFIVEKKTGSGRARIYVGQSSKRKNQKGMLNRCREHRRVGEFPNADDVVFLPTPAEFGASEFRHLENRFWHLIRDADAYELENGLEPQGAELRRDILAWVDDFVEEAECILAIFGYRPFVMVGPDVPVGPHDHAPAEHWANKTQLAKIIARRGGNEGAYGGILQLLSRVRACSPSSKWRAPLENAGIAFDASHFAVDWKTAKNPL